MCSTSLTHREGEVEHDRRGRMAAEAPGGEAIRRPAAQLSFSRTFSFQQARR
jgi:hypothetical protein